MKKSKSISISYLTYARCCNKCYGSYDKYITLSGKGVMLPTKNQFVFTELEQAIFSDGWVPHFGKIAKVSLLFSTVSWKNLSILSG